MTDPNVLLVVLDSVRARNCSLYGHENETTPFLDDFAEAATVYEQARAPSIHSVASHASIFTGHHVEEHGLIEHEDRLEPGSTVWEALADRGHETGLFTSNSVICEASNMGEAFGTYVGPPKAEGDTPDTKAAPPYVDRFLDWHAEREGPWAACLNFMDAHYPYRPREENDLWSSERLRDLHEEIAGGPLSFTFHGERPWWELKAMTALYDGGIRQCDRAIERIVETLADAGDLQDTLVVITSDHGEGFGEFSHVQPDVRAIDHSWGIHEVLTHVPLVVQYPGQRESRRVSDVASLTEFPSVVEEVTLEEARDAAFLPDGPALASTFRVKPSGDFLTDDCPNPDSHYGPWRAVYEDGEDGVVTKYVRRRDEAAATVECRDAQVSYRVAEDDDGRVLEAFGNLSPAGVRADESDDVELDDEVEQRLHDLGYLR